MPSLNQGEFLEMAIRSVIDQDYPNKELIVVDGGSVDNSLEVIHKYEDWLTHWRSEPDGGQSEAINKGLALCQGELFNWINSDDMLVPGALRCIGRAFVRWPESELIVGDHARCDERGNVLRISSPPSSLGMSPRAWAIPLGQQSSFYATKTVRQLGGVRQDLHQTMDGDLLYRHFRAKGRMQRVRGLVGVWRLHSAAKWGRCRIEVEQETKRILREYGIGEKDVLCARRLSQLGRMLDGSYWQSFVLTQRFKGRPWESLAQLNKRAIEDSVASFVGDVVQV